MAKEEKRVLELDKYEHGVVINALNDMRNDLIGEERPTDIVDEVLLKAIDAPTKNVQYYRHSKENIAGLAQNGGFTP